MAAGRVLVAVLVGLCVSAVVGFEAGSKPNNYPNFEFHESPVQDTAEVKPQNFESAEESRREYKPNNYADFKFTEEKTPVSGDGHDLFAKGQYSSFDASERFPAQQFGSHETFAAQDDAVFDAHQGRQVYYKTGEAEYRGSDARNRYPSSYDLINARESGNNKAGFEPFADNSDATNDPTATYGSTAPVLAANNAKKQGSPAVAAGHGCANMYWAEHTNEWPSFFSINTQVAQAFGLKAGDVFGTTTLLQALYDNREDGYSQLLSHGTAALMNAYAMPNYALRHDAVIDQFVGALSSRTAAGVQAQKFGNANHAYGPNECLN